MKKKGFLNLKLIVIILTIIVLTVTAGFYIKNNFYGKSSLGDGTSSPSSLRSRCGGAEWQL